MLSIVVRLSIVAVVARVCYWVWELQATDPDRAVLLACAMFLLVLMGILCDNLLIARRDACGRGE